MMKIQQDKKSKRGENVPRPFSQHLREFVMIFHLWAILSLHYLYDQVIKVLNDCFLDIFLNEVIMNNSSYFEGTVNQICRKKVGKVFQTRRKSNLGCPVLKGKKSLEIVTASRLCLEAAQNSRLFLPFSTAQITFPSRLENFSLLPTAFRMNKIPFFSP